MLKPIKIQDKKAPRFRWTRDRHYPLDAKFFKAYKNTVENPIEDFSLFRDVVEEFSEQLKVAAMNNRDGVKLPAMMGILAVCSYKPTTRFPVNWTDSFKSQLKLKEFNLHTGGLACKIVYSAYTSKYKFRNWALWRFEGNRDFKTRVSTLFETNYRYYKRLDNKARVSKMFMEDYITKVNKRNDNIRTDIIRTGDEQTPNLGLENIG